MTQNEQIIRMLRVGPATTAQILKECPCVVHSRINELRSRGYSIQCDRLPGIGAKAFRYRLLSEPDPDLLDPDNGSGSASSAGGGSTSETPKAYVVNGVRAQQGESHRVTGVPLLDSLASCPEPAQLTLESVA